MNNKHIFLLLFSLLWLFTMSACTHYQLQPGQIPMRQIPIFPTRGADLYPQQQNKNGLIIAADDYFDPQKSKQIFDINFADKNILMLEIIISNRSNDVYTIKNEEVFLMNDGQVIYPVSALKLELPKKKAGYFQFLELKDLVINPGENKNGFLYFQIPRGKEQSHFSPLWSSMDYKLRLGATKKNEGGDERLIYTIILQNL